MKQLLLTLVFGLSFPLFNLAYIRRKTLLGLGVTYENDLNYRKRKLRERRKGYKNRKFKKKRVYREKFYKLTGSHSKDSRYSNQRKIRRMHTSC